MGTACWGESSVWSAAEHGSAFLDVSRQGFLAKQERVPVHIPAWAWLAAIVGLLIIMVIDLVIVDRRRLRFTPRDAARWILLSVLVAALFAWSSGWSGVVDTRVNS
jgi:hypothetical protein